MSANSLPVILFTPDHRLQCVVPLPEVRLLDHLNDPRSEYLSIADIVVREKRSGRPLAALTESLLAKSAVRIIIPTATKHEAPEKRYNTFHAKTSREAFALVDGFELHAQIQLEGHDEPSYILTQELKRFVPFVNTSIFYRGEPFPLPGNRVVFVNKESIDLFELDPELEIAAEEQGQQEDHATASV